MVPAIRKCRWLSWKPAGRAAVPSGRQLGVVLAALHLGVGADLDDAVAHTATACAWGLLVAGPRYRRRNDEVRRDRGFAVVDEDKEKRGHGGFRFQPRSGGG